MDSRIKRTTASVRRFLSLYYLGRTGQAQRAKDVFTPSEAGDAHLLVTGEELINQIADAIRLRRSVIVTGPRGSGKSHCCEEAIRRSRDGDPPVIGGWHFLQGNREIPREYLSEDMLVLDENGKPRVLKALALRENDYESWASANKRPARWPVESALANTFRQRPEWPAVRATEIRRAQDAVSLWAPTDWTVLYLDEINRFGDGFLDSLLSLTEEGKIVRRGEEYFVPLVVIATANPPGYDLTAKRLSPPLQARIARSFRVAQPTTDDLVNTVVKKALARMRSLLGDFDVGVDLQYLAAAATLCLWGDPGSGEKGVHFLTSDTRADLVRAMDASPQLAKAMTTLSGLVTFGPDSRAVGDWLGAALGRAARRTRSPRTPELAAADLEETAVEVLGHKLRESFNEGTDPSASALKEFCIRTVVTCVLRDQNLRAVFYPYEAMVKNIFGVVQEVENQAASLAFVSQLMRRLPRDRRAIWVRLLSAPIESGQADQKAKESWVEGARKAGALGSGPGFKGEQEEALLAELLANASARGGVALRSWLPFRPPVSAALAADTG